MSKLLKSKFLLGVVTLAVAFVVSTSALAADGAVTMTLRQGMKNVQVKYLQQTLNEKGYTVATTGAGSVGNETTSFGPATTKAVKAFQKAMGLTADGIFGAKGRAALGGSVSTTYPAGCTSAVGFSSTTGLSCSGAVATTYPAGCTSAVGFSSTTGLPCNTTVVVTPQTGPITASLATDNPAAGTIIAGQATADLMHLTFTGTGTVSSLTLTRGGISDSSTLTNVYLYDGVTRLTDGYSFNTAGTLTINNLNLVVSGSKTISVKADVWSQTPSYNISVSLTSYTVGTTPTTVAIKGNDMYVASGSTLASLTLSGIQQVTGTNVVVNPGSNSYAVWRQAVQVNTRALNLKAANFRISGSAPADAVTNVNLYIDGVKAGNSATMTMTNGSNYLSFDMSAAPVSLTTGTHTLEVRADIAKGSSFTFTVSLQQASDLMIVDPQVGVNLAITSFTASTGASFLIGSGSYTLVNDSAFNTLTNVTAGVSNATIAKFNAHGYGEDVKVTSISVTPLFTGATAPVQAADPALGLQNVSLFFNGSQIGAQTASWKSGAIVFTPGSQMMITAGADNSIEIKADLRNVAGTAYTAGTVSANLSAIVGEGFHSHVASTGPATATGHTLNMQAGALTVSKNSNYSNQTVAVNVANAKIGSFTFQNTSSSDSVRVTSLTVNPIGAGTAATTDISGVSVSGTFSDGTVAFAPTTAQQPSTTNTFSVDFTLTPGQSANVDLLANTGATTGVTMISTILATAVSSNISVSQNGNGTAVAGQTISINVGTLANTTTSPILVVSNSTPISYVASPAGKTDVVKASYTFNATGGSVTISKLKFLANGTSTSYGSGTITATGDQPLVVTSTTGFAPGDAVTISAATTNATGIVKTVTDATHMTVTISSAGVGAGALVYKNDGASSVRVGTITASFNNGVAWLQNVNIPVSTGGTGTSVDAYLSFPTVGSSNSSLVSGATSSVTLYSVEYTNGNTTTILGNGGTALNGTSLTSNLITLTGSTPTVRKTSSPLSVGVGATNNVKVGTIAITANDGDVLVGVIPVTFSNLGGANSGWTVKVNGTAITSLGGTQPTSDSSGFSFTNGYQISKGNTVSFDLYANVSNTGTSSGNVDLTLGANASFKWSDIIDNLLTSASMTKTGTNLTTYNN